MRHRDVCCWKKTVGQMQTRSLSRPTLLGDPALLSRDAQTPLQGLPPASPAPPPEDQGPRTVTPTRWHRPFPQAASLTAQGPMRPATVTGSLLGARDFMPPASWTHPECSGAGGQRTGTHRAGASLLPRKPSLSPGEAGPSGLIHVF